MTIEIVASCVCVIAMIIFVPLFLKAAWPEKNKRSLLFKMICATLFVVIALLQMRIADNYSGFARFMLWGFLCSWFGDLFLHIPAGPTKLWYPLGVLSFLSGHIMFLSAYALASEKLLNIPFFNAVEIAILAPIILTMLVYLIYKAKKISNKLLPFLSIYAVAVLGMMIKAIRLGIELFTDGQQSLFVTFLLAVGGIFFVTSDFLLLLIDFGDSPGKPVRFKKPWIKSINIWTYFVAQCLLAFTILFVET